MLYASIILGRSFLALSIISLWLSFVIFDSLFAFPTLELFII